MRLAVSILLAFCGVMNFANAAPLIGALAADHPIQVQMRCTPSSCIDMQSGVYTQSTCDQYGCRPIGGAVGRIGPDGYDRPRYSGNRYGRFDCSPTRCIDMSSGMVWESTCDYRGCRPLQPARERYY